MTASSLKKDKTAFIINAITAVLEIAGLAVAISRYGLGIMGYYTQESNLVLLVACIVYLVYAGRRLKDPSYELPYLVALFKYIATCLVSVTFVVVVLVLIPMAWGSMGAASIPALLFGGANVFHHFLCPLLAMVTFFGFERDCRPHFKETVYAMLPTLMYAVVTVILNVAKVVRGPYPFLYVYEQPWFMSVRWFVLIVGGAWGYAAIGAVLTGKKSR